MLFSAGTVEVPVGEEEEEEEEQEGVGRRRRKVQNVAGMTLKTGY